MKILQVGTMPCGTSVQLEHWESDTHLNISVDKVAAYPKALESLSGQFAPKRGRSFRLAIDFDSKEEAAQAYEEIKAGKKQLLDYKNKFQNKEFIICI